MAVVRQAPELYLEIGLSMADYLIENEQPEAALELLDSSRRQAPITASAIA